MRVLTRALSASKTFLAPAAPARRGVAEQIISCVRFRRLRQAISWSMSNMESVVMKGWRQFVQMAQNMIVCISAMPGETGFIFLLRILSCCHVMVRRAVKPVLISWAEPAGRPEKPELRAASVKWQINLLRLRLNVKSRLLNLFMHRKVFLLNSVRDLVILKQMISWMPYLMC